jgi:hypothetical protein
MVPTPSSKIIPNVLLKHETEYQDDGQNLKAVTIKGRMML